MEIEKPFKCTTCNSYFTNEDHLSVHRRRHEMSLNLKGQGQMSLNSLDSFADETPTPTRFFKSCEEVGLFHDLQNINPFDEQFAKANSAGTSGEEFDFSMDSISTSQALHLGGSSKKRYADQDTLNTPQILHFTNCNTSNTTINVPTTTTTNNLLENQVLEEETGTSDVGKGAESTGVGKLQLLPITTAPQSYSFNTSIATSLNTGDPPEKVEMRERNKAAACRSRQRRKQWISSLEDRCRALEKQLAQTRFELLREQTNSQVLRNELAKHANCDVTKSKPQVKLEKLLQLETKIILGAPYEPSSIHEGYQGDEPRVLLTTLHSTETNVMPTKAPAKRGRPRKGQERQPPGIVLPQIILAGEPLSKIPLCPISRAPVTKK